MRAEIDRLGPYDVILSDAAPATSGNRSLDTTRSAELVEMVLEIADELLVAGGAMVAKLFQGGDEQRLLAAVRERFRVGKMQQPKASRSESFEVFLVGIDRRRDDG